MITIHKGDIFESKAQTITNTINCVGAMGKGLALAFKSRYPGMYKEYRALCRGGAVQPGKPYVYNELDGTSILMFPTKRHWRQASLPEDIQAGLRYLAAHYADWGITELALPPLGCGNGGLSWQLVGPMIYRELSHLPIPIMLFAPPSTPPEQMTISFLQSVPEDSEEWLQPIPESCYVIPEVLYQLSLDSFARPVGHVIFQKICYILSNLGLDMGLSFTKGAYGPFSEDVKRVLQVLIQQKLLQETSMGGDMLRISPSFSYTRIRSRFQKIIVRHREAINRTIDLFARIHSSEHAEMVATILFVAQELKQHSPADNVTEWDVLNHVLQWKPHWNLSEKRMLLSDNIRSLEMLRWLRLRLCPDFFKEEWEC